MTVSKCAISVVGLGVIWLSLLRLRPVPLYAICDRPIRNWRAAWRLGLADDKTGHWHRAANAHCEMRGTFHAPVMENRSTCWN